MEENVIYVCVKFLSGACLWGRNCVREEISERNGSREQAHFKKNVLCLSQSKTLWIEKKWQNWRFVVSDGAKTFF